MTKVTPQQGATKIGQRIAQSGQAYQDGINKVTVNPAQLAIEANDKWVAGIQDAIQNDRFRKGLSRVTLNGWKNSALTYGVTRYTGSAQKATANYLAFATEFYPFLDNAVQTIDSMPQNTLEDNIQRMVAMVRAIHEYKNR